MPARALVDTGHRPQARCLRPISPGASTAVAGHRLSSLTSAAQHFPSFPHMPAGPCWGWVIVLGPVFTLPINTRCQHGSPCWGGPSSLTSYQHFPSFPHASQAAARARTCRRPGAIVHTPSALLTGAFRQPSEFFILTGLFARDGNLQHVMYNQFFICRLIRKVAGQRIGWKLRPCHTYSYGYSSSA
jgi:hypothetical protein